MFPLRAFSVFKKLSVIQHFSSTTKLLWVRVPRTSHSKHLANTKCHHYTTNACIVLPEDYLKDFAKYIMTMLPRYVEKANLFHDELTLYVTPAALVPVMTFLRDHSNTQFKSLMDITGADYPGRERRFEVIYHMLSVRYNARIRVKTYASEVQGVPSLAQLFASANWFEREIWDMFGVQFVDHPDLRRILTDYGFEGHPFRKDFPLTGYVEVRYDEEKKRVVAEPLQMTQEYRKFDLGNPWRTLPKKSDRMESMEVKEKE